MIALSKAAGARVEPIEMTPPMAKLFAIQRAASSARTLGIHQRQCKIRWVVSIVLALAPGCSAAQTSAIGYRSVGAARAALANKPAVQTTTQAGWTIVTDEQGNDFTTWTFAPRTHPAYPSVVRRDIVFKDGNPTLITRVLCEARRATCDALYSRLRGQIARCTSNCTTVLP